MSTVFSPGWAWTPSTRSTAITFRAPEAQSFAAKVANNSMNSFHLVQSAMGEPAVVRYRAVMVPDLYKDSGVNVASQSPIKQGKRGEVEFYGLGQLVTTNGTTSATSLIPVNCGVWFETTNTYLDTDPNVNVMFEILFKEILLGSLLRTSGENTYIDFTQMLKGVCNLPDGLPK